MNTSTRKIVLNGMLIALVFVVTYLTRIPAPIAPGYFNIGDAVIIFAAIMMGRNSGLMAGALGSCLADLMLGATVYAPVTLVVKGLEGWIIGSIAFRGEKTQNVELWRIVATVIGVSVMVSGYFVSEASFLTLMGSDFGWSYAVANLPINLLQAGVSAAVGYSVATSLVRAGLRKLT